MRDHAIAVLIGFVLALLFAAATGPIDQADRVNVEDLRGAAKFQNRR